MPLSEDEELELLELENEEALAKQARRPESEAAIRPEYPSETFARYAEPISQFGGMLAKTPGIGAGLAGAATMGAEIAKQGIQAVGSEPGTPRTFMESGRRIGQAFARGAGGELLGRGVFKGAQMAGERMIPAGAQFMKVTAGIPEDVGARVLREPSMLRTAPTVEQAGKQFSDVIEQSGNVYAAKATKKATGKLLLGEQAKIDLLNDSITKIDQVTGFEHLPENAPFIENLTQQALAARYQIGKMLRASKWNDPKLAAERVELKQAEKIIDNWLEPRVPGYSEAVKNYAKAKSVEEFSSWFPRNINKTAAGLRGLLAVGSAGAGLGGYVDPTTAAAGIAVTSPRLLGYGLRAGLNPVTREGAKLGVRLGTQSLAGQIFPSSTTEDLRRRYMGQR